MRLVSFGPVQAERPGVLIDDDTILPLGPLLTEFGLPDADMNPVLGLLPFLRPTIEEAIARAEHTVPVASVRLGPPVPRPPKVIVVGGNYQSHVDEAYAVTKGRAPSTPIIVLKPNTNVVGPFDPIVRPLESEQLDYEAEMLVVMGRAGRRIPRERAFEHIAGYMNGDDVGVRDVMMGEAALSPLYMQPTRGKGFDTFCPCGPYLATTDEVPNPDDLRIRLWVNGDLRQDDSTRDMIVDVAGIVAEVSAVMTLQPGDIMLTGTPAGCGGMADPPVYLQPGDVVRQEIAGLGAMENPIADEPR